METMAAFAMALANRGKAMMVFDWDKAAKIIKETGAKEASAGLCGDWEWTGGNILVDGRPASEDESPSHLSSHWATPELEIDGCRQDCYKMMDGSVSRRLRRYNGLLCRRGVVVVWGVCE